VNISQQVLGNPHIAKHQQKIIEITALRKAKEKENDDIAKDLRRREKGLPPLKMWRNRHHNEYTMQINNPDNPIEYC